jgi:hypothetical protein
MSPMAGALHSSSPMAGKLHSLSPMAGPLHCMSPMAGPLPSMSPMAGALDHMSPGRSVPYGRAGSQRAGWSSRRSRPAGPRNPGKTRSREEEMAVECGGVQCSAVQCSAVQWSGVDGNLTLIGRRQPQTGPLPHPYNL